MKEEIKLEEIKLAKKNFGNFIKTTALEKSERLSEKYYSQIYLKREDLQEIRSYKIRGAFNLISSLKKEEKENGIVCASAGNHAQGVAITCNKLKIKGTIFMPVTTPEQKVYKTKQFGGKYINIKLTGDTFDEAFKASKEFEKENNAIFVHPFDDYRVITGQSTIGLEIFKQLKFEPDYIICPIGGGGMIAGIITTRNLLKKKTKIIGVEPSGATSMKTSIEKGKNTKINKIDTFVDGASVASIGERNFEIVRNDNTEILISPENRVCTTMLEYLKEDGIVLEPAGALTTDVLKDISDRIKNKKVVIIISGGNFDFERLPEVKERSMKYEGVKKYFLVSFPQRPGALREFLGVLGDGDDIERFEYLKKSAKNRAPVFIGIKTQNKNNWGKIENNMKKLGFKYKDVTNDELYFDLLV